MDARSRFLIPIYCYSTVTDALGSTDMFRSLLSKSKKHKSCYGCDRGLSTSEMVEFEAYVSQNRIYPTFIAEHDDFRSHHSVRARSRGDLKI
jgi:hypothetical protein